MEYRDFGSMTLSELTAPFGYDCACGRHHAVDLKYLKIGRGAVECVPEALAKLGVKRPYIVCDENTKAAAADRVCEILDAAGIGYNLLMIPTHEQRTKPDELSLGSMAMEFDPTCDFILGVGSGVINDLCKVLGHVSKLNTGIVGTAPSMDGYASNSSSMEVRDVKTTLYNKSPAAIILDTEIMAKAPMRLLWAGLGDMIAKYISVWEWKVVNLAAGEYYCENIAGIMKNAVKKVVAAAPGIPERDPDAIQAIAEGLVAAGIAMAYAKVSRPASGLEHYFSHMWEMMALERKKPYDLHGIQVGVGSLVTMRLIDKLRSYKPDMATVERSIAEFDQKAWEANVRRVFGETAPEIFAIEKKARKNDPVGRRKRAKAAIEHWDEIQALIARDIPPYDEIFDLMKKTGMPLYPADLDIDDRDARDAFVCSRDMRDRFLTSSLLWDLGAMDEFADLVKSRW